MRIWKRFAALLLAVVMLLSMAACGGNAPQEETQAPTQAPTVPVETEAPTEPDPIMTVVDQAGREVDLYAMPQTIASCSRDITSLSIALGLKDRLAGIEADAEFYGLYALAAPQLLGVPAVADEDALLVDTLVELKPDLVLLPKAWEDQATELEAQGLMVLVLDLEYHSTMEAAVRLLADVCDVKSTARELLAYYKVCQDRILSILEADDDYDTTVYMAGENSVLTCAQHPQYPAEMVTYAGGINAVEDWGHGNWMTLTAEELENIDPNVIIIPGNATYSLDSVMDDDDLEDVDAVEDDDVYRMPSGLETWQSPGCSGILGVLWLTSILHSDEYDFEQFQADAAAYYEKFYGFTVDTALITRD